MSEGRKVPANPESFLRLIERSHRGRLKVYLGYGPGVGKTYQMLLEGHRLKARGIDVAVGLIETHGRADTASLLLGLEVFPLREVVYRGVHLQEMDLEGLLARRPEVVLVDELAHTNVPGSRHEKRYLDVQELLSAGIHVVTTLNVQHLESLYDAVERLVGVKVRERLPDWVLAEADQVVNVDLAAEDLRRRLEEGQVYDPERSARALTGFFQPENLERLRELALREGAAWLERRGRGGDETRGAGGGSGVQAPDQVVVCLSSKSPEAAALLRYASRLAGRLNRNWYALYVRTAAEDPAQLDEETRKRLADTLDLARLLGAMVFTFQGEDVADTILRFAREYHVGHIVLGRSVRPRTWLQHLRRLRGNDLLDRLLERAEGIAVVVADPRGGPLAAPVVSPETEPPTPAPRTEARTPALSDLLHPEAILFVDRPLGRDQLLARLASTLLGENEPPGREELIRRIERRDREASTFVGGAFALPHLRLPEIDSPRLAFAIARPGFAVTGWAEPVELATLLLAPDTDPKIALTLLSALARLARDSVLREKLRTATGPEQVIAELRESERGQEGIGGGPASARVRIS